MKELMTRAWEIYRTLEGTHRSKLSKALKMAWAEVNDDTASKQTFGGIAKLRKPTANYDSDSAYLFFNIWEKGDLKRIYINDYKRRTIGYINVADKSAKILDCQGCYESEITSAIDAFNAAYTY